MAVAGCGGEPVVLPSEPASFTAHDHYQFGDGIGARDAKAIGDAYKMLSPRFGRLREGQRELPATVAPDAVRADLAKRLEADGWVPVPELDGHRRNGSYAFGWSKDGKVYAIVGLDHQPAVVPISPVTILTNIGDPNEVL